MLSKNSEEVSKLLEQGQTWLVLKNNDTAIVFDSLPFNMQCVTKYD